MDNNIFYPRGAEDRGFTLKCALRVNKYVKVPAMFYIYRSMVVSQSRQPPTLDAIAKMPGGMAKFAAELEDILDEIDFFRDHPIYKYRIIELQLNALDIHSGIRYYPSGQTLNLDVVDAVYRKSAEDFGEHAPFINWLFHRYHIFFRRCLELEAQRT